VTDAAAWDVVVVGAGAAGLATAIFAARAAPSMRIVCLDGAAHIGAKILVSGGSRCNVTNRTVTEHDFWGGPPRFVRHVLRAFPAARAAGFFEELGVALHDEEDGKLFPDTNRARTVLDALLREAARLRIAVRSSSRVASVTVVGNSFTVGLVDGRTIRAGVVVLATGGRSLPKTGSDGMGYRLAQALGHTIVDTIPGLAPLVLEGTRHAALAGRSHPATLSLRVDGRPTIALTGSLLWTHFGISGPVALNMSRHWHRARLDADALRTLTVAMNLCPGETQQSLETWLRQQARDRPRARVATVLATRLPADVADAWTAGAGIATDTTLAHVTRPERRALVDALLDTPLSVRDSRGYNYAEVTAGGVPLEEIDHRTMGSRTCPGLFLVGEILDVDGRLGGFNFQWAWSSGWVAGQAIASRSDGEDGPP
jgi:predicted Rossmann fold flavoprotein